MTKLVLLVCALIALVSAQCNGQTRCSRPATYTNFTRLNLEDVRKEIRYYFPSNPTPPPSIFTSDGSAIPSLQFKTAASLSVTFMFEGAGNRNQLGYYTFDLNANNQVINKQEFILFPDIETGDTTNTNCVWTGMTVTSPVIPAGKRFGFFLISNGYCGGTQKFYTDSSLNTPNDVNVRHVGLYVDFFRELLIIGFEDLLRAGWDNDFEDTMFIFDSNGVEVQFDGVPYACTRPPCSNGGICNYNTGECDCSRTKYTGRSCTTCSCSDGNPCTEDICNGNQCLGTTYVSDISSCLAGQSCTSRSCVTTAAATTAVATTAQATTRAATTAVATTAQATTGATSAVTTGQATTGRATTGNPTTGRTVFTTGNPTTGRGTTGLPTTGEYVPSNTNVRPNYTITDIPEGTIPTVSSDERESGAVLIGLSFVCYLAVLLF